MGTIEPVNQKLFQPQVDQKSQQYDKLFAGIVLADVGSDQKVGNIFEKEKLNKDYVKALSSKDPNERRDFVDKLITSDYFAGENADKKTDGLMDGKSIFALKDNDDEKKDLLTLYKGILESLGLNRPQEGNEACPATSPSFGSASVGAPVSTAPTDGVPSNLDMSQISNEEFMTLLQTLINGLGSNNSANASANPAAAGATDSVANSGINPSGVDPFGMNEIRMLAGELFAPKNYSPQQIQEMNRQGIYTDAAQMSPEMMKNITSGKVKDIQAGTYGGVKLNGDQVNNAKVIAATIVEEGKKKNKSPQEIQKAVVIALATAMQESTLKNIGNGDKDSVGLFQQRPSCGWGTKEQCKDPVYATRKFAEKLYQTDYMNKSVTAAAQGVQRSGFPEAYAKHQKMAEDLAKALLSEK